ncbi:hypothetical protein [Chryseobacterium sp. CT-SW4]|uniref:hypothetical protein n=1 Tax=Chryseobacterium sp. SW-1 TaxID=3157343 RepID=UPI003B0227D5
MLTVKEYIYSIKIDDDLFVIVVEKSINSVKYFKNREKAFLYKMDKMNSKNYYVKFE